VRFMAETAKILSPGKKVIMPDPNAGCPMADMITVQGLTALKNKYPEAVAVGYVNTTAEVKTKIDICCTSGNAVQVINSIEKGRQIIFAPDKYLAAYVSKKTGREMIIWNGCCPAHANILPGQVRKVKKEHPDAVMLAHPECRGEVLELAQEVLSTEGMVKFAKKTKEKKIIIGTEYGIIHRLKKENPEKEFISISKSAVCPSMKLTTLEKLLWSLEDMQHEIILADEILKNAKKCVDRMIELG
jgi:quinolinate synthase